MDHHHVTTIPFPPPFKSTDEKAQDAINLVQLIASGERFGLLTDEAKMVLDALESQQRRLALAARIIKRYQDEEWKRVTED